MPSNVKNVRVLAYVLMTNNVLRVGYVMGVVSVLMVVININV